MGIWRWTAGFVVFCVLPDENLDNTTIGRNWAEKIIRALREHNLQWGLLTNGKQWRIYHLDEPTPYETYLEIDLEAILTDKAKEAYQIFHKFMKAENFAAKKMANASLTVSSKSHKIRSIISRKNWRTPSSSGKRAARVCFQICVWAMWKSCATAVR